ncbi:SAM-dependent methyltransferase [Legionella geestiana]|uniref:SAM-dependent methyltransferase n=1 Tax=Legionella geestiana TaxID=45065 RepID=A0A0W0TWS3_9GAMM|nr:SAM-dependent methyltransferase [Legionella geestiana]KTD00096.1 SAM-dependent methyltransferase [Legionella geestiana]QBS11365.1 SAM-dependent methyltransferase [Legionella geestiana]QDQ38917.1 SAM-dependent methyltransferase [Legionella geestiana]STX53981.1 SAM-dependent methyltransferase [Legionella geestiana]
MQSCQSIKSVYVAKPECLPALQQEIGRCFTVKDSLLFSAEPAIEACFALDIWEDIEVLPFASISEAARILRAHGRFWYFHPLEYVRRGRLIEEQLPKLPELHTPFRPDIQVPAIGAFTLIDRNTLLLATKRLKKWPDGKSFFVEDRVNPPNRAYLKLWEALFVMGRSPEKGARVFDLGASPGGWTWVMQSLGAQVTAVDKAALDPKIAALPGVTCLQQSAFSIEPATLTEKVDWVLSDIACYPARALQLIEKWIDSERAGNLIFTIKLQGETDFTVLNTLRKIPNARVLNLYWNKHEATFLYPVP